MDKTPAPAGAASIANASSSFHPERPQAGRGRPPPAGVQATWDGPAFPFERLGRQTEWLLLLGAGLVAALLHETFRWPLKLPGHHGLEWLAVLMAARLWSRQPGAALAVALGAAITAVAAGGGHEIGLRPMVYLLQGLALDALWRWRGDAGLPAWWQAALMGAAVHALSPLAKAALAAAGSVQAGALAQGLAWPLATHLAFGAVGAAAGAVAVATWRQARRR